MLVEAADDGNVNTSTASSPKVEINAAESDETEDGEGGREARGLSRLARDPLVLLCRGEADVAAAPSLLGEALALDTPHIPA